MLHWGDVDIIRIILFIFTLANDVDLTDLTQFASPGRDVLLPDHQSFILLSLECFSLSLVIFESEDLFVVWEFEWVIFVD
jgi:hypothetical protein